MTKSIPQKAKETNEQKMRNKIEDPTFIYSLLNYITLHDINIVKN